MADLTFIFQPHQISLLRLEQTSCFPNRTRDHKTTNSRTVKTASSISLEHQQNFHTKKREDTGSRIQVGQSGFWLNLLAQALVVPQPAQLQEAPPTLAAGVCVSVCIWCRAALRQLLFALALGRHLSPVSFQVKR